MIGGEPLINIVNGNKIKIDNLTMTFEVESIQIKNLVSKMILQV